MTDKEKELQDEEEDMVVVLEDEDGNESYFVPDEEMILLGDDQFVVLYPVTMDEEDESDAHEHEHDHDHEHGCDCGCEDEESALIMKVILDEKGEEIYVEPTEEEFEAVSRIVYERWEEEDAVE